MVLGIQIAGFLFGLFLMYYSFLNYKRKQFSVKEFLFWCGAWALFVYIAIFPYHLDPVVKRLGFLRTLDLLVITGFLVIILAVFYTYTVGKKNQRMLEAVVREMAMKKAKK